MSYSQLLGLSGLKAYKSNNYKSNIMFDYHCGFCSGACSTKNCEKMGRTGFRTRRYSLSFGLPTTLLDLHQKYLPRARFSVLMIFRFSWCTGRPQRFLAISKLTWSQLKEAEGFRRTRAAAGECKSCFFCVGKRLIASQLDLMSSLSVIRVIRAKLINPITTNQT